MKYNTNDKPSIRPERIEAVRRLLQDLPEKDTRISKRETVIRLEADIRKALKKGYTPKEIVALMKAGGIIVSMQLIKEVIEHKNKKEILQEDLVETSAHDTLEKEPTINVESTLGTDTEVHNTLGTDTKESVLEKGESNHAEVGAKTLEKVVEAGNKTTKEYRGQFAIRPDRPKGEL